jgi:hypothetical protein
MLRYTAVVVDMPGPTVAFDTVGPGVHNVSTEKFCGMDTRRGQPVSLRAQKPRFLVGLAPYDRFIYGFHPVVHGLHPAECPLLSVWYHAG